MRTGLDLAQRCRFLSNFKDLALTDADQHPGNVNVLLRSEHLQALLMDAVIKNIQVEKSMEFVARIIACIVLICVQFPMINNKPQMAAGLIAEALC